MYGTEQHGEAGAGASLVDLSAFVDLAEKMQTRTEDKIERLREEMKAEKEEMRAEMKAEAELHVYCKMEMFLTKQVLISLIFQAIICQLRQQS